jgi:hypothetical protein
MYTLRIVTPTKVINTFLGNSYTKEIFKGSIKITSPEFPDGIILDKANKNFIVNNVGATYEKL